MRTGKISRWILEADPQKWMEIRDATAFQLYQTEILEQAKQPKVREELIQAVRSVMEKNQEYYKDMGFTYVLPGKGKSNRENRLESRTHLEELHETDKHRENPEIFFASQNKEKESQDEYSLSTTDKNLYRPQTSRTVSSWEQQAIRQWTKLLNSSKWTGENKKRPKSQIFVEPDEYAESQMFAGPDNYPESQMFVEPDNYPKGQMFAEPGNYREGQMFAEPGNYREGRMFAGPGNYAEGQMFTEPGNYPKGQMFAGPGEYVKSQMFAGPSNYPESQMFAEPDNYPEGKMSVEQRNHPESQVLVKPQSSHARYDQQDLQIKRKAGPSQKEEFFYAPVSIVTVRPPNKFYQERQLTPSSPQIETIIEQVKQEAAEDIRFVNLGQEKVKINEKNEQQLKEILKRISGQQKELEQMKQIQARLIQSTEPGRMAEIVMKQFKGQIQIEKMRKGG